MVRLAPSANNRQSWRIVLEADRVHFYRQKASVMDFSRTDIGIALCHFDLSCRELGIQGTFKVLDDLMQDRTAGKNHYSISWIKAD
jgi:hypothetical protein